MLRWCWGYDGQHPSLGGLWHGYFGFNVDRELHNVKWAEYRERGAIEAAKDGDLDRRAQEFRVRDCIQLKLKENVYVQIGVKSLATLQNLGNFYQLSSQISQSP
jgi:hypothetical protein